MALAWRSVTPVSTSRGNQPLVLGSPITGAARRVVCAVGVDVIGGHRELKRISVSIRSTVVWTRSD